MKQSSTLFIVILIILFFGWIGICLYVMYLEQADPVSPSRSIVTPSNAKVLVSINADGEFTFFHEGKPVGHLAYRNGIWTFDGNAEKSAQLFFKYVIQNYAKKGGER